jgi:hypothetical protein
MVYLYTNIYEIGCYFEYFDKYEQYIYTDFPSCLNINSIFDDTTNRFEIKKPEMISDHTGMSICTKIPFVEPISGTNKPILCAELILTYFLKNFFFVGDETIKVNFLSTTLLDENQKLNLNENLISLFFFNDEYLKENVRVTFNDSIFNDHTIESDSTPITLFHYLYIDIFLNNTYMEAINIDTIFSEYNQIFDIIVIKLNNIITKFNENKSTSVDDLNEFFYINKTICYQKLFSYEPECQPDSFQVLISPFIINDTSVTDNFMMDIESNNNKILFFIFSLVQTRSNYLNYYFKGVLRIKNFRLFIFFITFSSCMIFIIYLSNRIVIKWLLDLIIKIKKELNFLEEIEEFSESLANTKNKKEKEKLLTKANYFYDRLYTKKLSPKNIEMKSLAKIFDTIKREFILKQIVNSNQDLQTFKKYFSSLQNIIDNQETKQCMLLLAYSHFKHKDYKLSGKEFVNLLDFINKKEKNLFISDTFENSLKDKIQRYIDSIYINDYTQIERLDETILPIIKIKQLKQKILYLYALNNFFISNNQKYSNTTTYKQKFTIVNNNTNLNNNQNNMDINLLIAFNAFKETRKINQILGMNPIREIYCLIMMARCQIQNKVYRDAIEYINEANILFVDFINLFKENQSKSFNPKVMLFVFDNIFQTLMLTTAQCAVIMGKSNAVGWIIIKMFQTSPFLLEPQHSLGSKLLLNTLRTLDKNKTNKKLTKIYQNTKKLFSKIYTRMNISKNNYKKKINDLNNNLSSNTKQSGSYQNLINRRNSGGQNNLNVSLVRESQFLNSNNSQANYLQEIYQSNLRNTKKEITICMSEKILMEINGLELKDVFIKYFQKFFINNDQDKFGYLQFSNSGKRLYIKPQKLEQFIQKLQENKNFFNISENNIYNNNDTQFKDLFNILETIIKQDNRDDYSDNIILIFIKVDDFRLTSKEECIKIVNDLNENNFSLFFFCNDEEINENKIKNIKMFIDGLFEAYFIHYKNYQIIKQVLMNLSTMKKQENFHTFGFENMDCFI